MRVKSEKEKGMRVDRGELWRPSVLCEKVRAARMQQRGERERLIYWILDSVQNATRRVGSKGVRPFYAPGAKR